jgi:hypothetical protein
VGKSHNIDEVIEAAVRGDGYDLVIALLPTRRLIEERRWIREPPGDVHIVKLRPRPRERCGKERDADWQHYEKAGLGALGRLHICKGCPRRRGCPWPKQYGRKLRGARVIYGTQVHLERAPEFIFQLKQWTHAERVLVVLDEVNFLMTSYQRRILHADLQRFVDTLRHLHPHKWGPRHREWLYRADLLLRASTEDLRHPGWQMPRFYPAWSLAVQECGWELYGLQFRFLGYALQQLGYAPMDSRERDPQGDLLFATPPALGYDFVLYSGTAHPEFSKFRLGRDFASPFDDYRFEHPATTWYNIASRLGTRSYFARNADQVLDFFAGLVARRLREGHRPLLVAKKCFVKFCAREMARRLNAWGIENAQIVVGGWEKTDLSAPSVIPLLSFGAIGTNLFEQFDCAYCLTGYYTTEAAVNAVLQDVLASDGHIPIRITTEGQPRRRRAGVVDPKDRNYDVHRLAQLALAHQEMDVVLQAVGRVRPYTRPREVITFQCAEHPHLAYTREFDSLGQARAFFEIPHFRARRQQEIRARIQALRRGGQTQAQVAQEIGVSLRTVKRYWK